MKVLFGLNRKISACRLPFAPPKIFTKSAKEKPDTQAIPAFVLLQPHDRLSTLPQQA